MVARIAGNPTFISDFSRSDPNWVTRHTPNPDLRAGERCPKINDRDRMVLRLRSTQDGEVRTSHIATKQSFIYGRFEARMVFLGGKGAHSAFWLQDVEPNQLGGSEVDIIEHFGSDHALWNNVYWRTPETLWPKEPTRWRQKTDDFNPRQWHVYSVDWYPDGYYFRIDGQAVSSTRQGASSKPKVMILSLLSSKWEWPNLDEDNLHKYRTLVDWVKYTPLNGV